MHPGDGWYLLGPVLAFAVVGLLTLIRWANARPDDAGQSPPWPDGLELFAEPDDFGLLQIAALTDEREVADEVRRLLTGAGIRSTLAVDTDGRTRVLVFAEELDRARRLVGGTPGRP